MNLSNGLVCYAFTLTNDVIHQSIDLSTPQSSIISEVALARALHDDDPEASPTS